MARLLLGSSATDGGRTAPARFSYLLHVCKCHFEAEPGVGRVVCFPHRETWFVQQAGFHWNESRWRICLHLVRCAPGQSLLHLRRQSRSSPGAPDEDWRFGYQRCAIAPRLREYRSIVGQVLHSDRKYLSISRWSPYHNKKKLCSSQSK